MTRFALLLLAFAAPLTAQQVDSTLVVARRLASEGQADSARSLVRAMLGRTSPTDSAYPSALFTAGVIAGDVDSARMYFRRVSIEYSNSPRAGDALLRLAQLAFATNDFSGAARTARRVVFDFPLSDVRLEAAFWTARAELELGNLTEACRHLNTIQSDTTADVELVNRVRYYAQRCTAAAQVEPTDTADTPAEARPAGPPTFAVQVAAVSSVAAADEVMRSLNEAGHRARVSRDADGLWKVRVGRFTNRIQAQQLAARLKAQLGGSPFVVEER